MNQILSCRNNIILPIFLFTFAIATPAFNINQDGQTDLAWHYETGIANYSWLMNGVTQIQAVSLGESPPSDWKLLGKGDFDRDGHSDLLFRNATDGQMAVWFMTNSSRKAAAVLGIVGDLNYYVVGTGDFNEDGVLDILWHHNTADQSVVWFMNSVSDSNYTFTSGNIGWCPSNPDPIWYASATGDFNNDNRTDIVWRNTSNGQNLVWFMSGTTKLSQDFLPQNPLLSAKLVATGHYNREGHTDLVWRDNSGINSIWLIGGANGLTLQGMFQTTLPSEPDLNWVIKGNGGYTNTLALAATADPVLGSITVKWRPGTTVRTIVRTKLPSETVWTPIAANYYPFSIIAFGKSQGQRYEYNIGGDYYPGQPYVFPTGGDYIVTAINDRAIEDRGTVMLVIENSLSTSLATELARLKTDLVGDGWTVLRTDVPRHNDDVNNYSLNSGPIASIRSFILGNYNASKTNVVFLIGSSGNFR
jgi:hypothetical protein